jgi:hypothetical protein
MSGSFRSLLAAGAIAVLPLAPAALRAQTAQTPAPSAAPAATADSMAFPRQFVKWVFAGQGDSAYAHAGPRLRESMQSAEAVSGMAARIQTRFGQAQGTDAEVQFDDGAQKVYIVVMRFPQAPEPGAWMVAYTPGTRVVERAGFSPLSSVKSRYPNAKLP